MQLVITTGPGKHDKMEVFGNPSDCERMERLMQGISSHDVDYYYPVENPFDKRGVVGRAPDSEDCSVSDGGGARIRERRGGAFFVELFQSDGSSASNSKPADVFDLYQVTCRSCQRAPLGAQAENNEVVRTKLFELMVRWQSIPVGKALSLQSGRCQHLPLPVQADARNAARCSTPTLGAMKILAISGSLRKASLNTALLCAVARIAPPEINVVLYRGLGALPLFNPDFETPEPISVATLREQILTSDALLIASPEYAHGVSGVIKNALDWMVGNESFIRKPVALLNASPRATCAYAALRETISTMSARVIDEACIAVPILGSGLSEDDIIEHPEIKPALLAALLLLKEAALQAASERLMAI